MEQKYIDCAVRVLNAIGVKADGDFIADSFVCNSVETKETDLHGVKVRVSVVRFEGGTCRIDIDFSLPEEAVLANAFMEHCAAIEKTPKNHHHEWCAGPMYSDFASELAARKGTFALSPWNDHFFYVRSEGYGVEELDEAARNAITLAKQFADHLPELSSLRYWKTTDPEVVAKAAEIVANADLHETDCDREDRAHWLVDRNSFFKGWFYPFNDRGRGTFDTVYKADFGAFGIEGSFEYAVSCLLIHDRDYIGKARKACFIREETRTVRY